MEHHATDESVSEFVAKPRQVDGVAQLRCCRGFDLDADHPSAAQFSEQVDLVAATLRAQMMQARLARCDGDLRPQLCRDEGVEHSPEQVSIAQDAVNRHASQGHHERRLNDVALRCRNQPLQAVCRPRRHLFNDEQARQQTLVGQRRIARHTGVVMERLLFRGTRAVERIRLQVRAQTPGITRSRGPRLSLQRIARQQVIEVAREPRAPHAVRHPQRDAGEPTDRGQLNAIAKVGRLLGVIKTHPVDDAVEERRPVGSAPQLALGHPEHRNADDPAGPRPHAMVEIRRHRPGEQESPCTGVEIHRSADRSEDPRRLLPLIEQDRFVQTAQGRIGIGDEGGRLRLRVQPDDRRGTPRRRGRLAAGPRSHHDNGAQLT
jgi:hypothetical protein